MSIKAKEYHGLEMKCMGAPYCSDCKEKQEVYGLGLHVWFLPSETTIGCICTNCGHRWSEEITAYVVKNSLYERYFCTNCNPVSGAV